MRLAVIGTGRMGSAIVSGILNHHLLPPSSIVGCSEDAAHREAFLKMAPGLGWADNARQAAQDADWILISVKPPQVSTVLRAMQPHPGQRVLSVAAGISLATLAAGCAPGTQVCRIMPNTPVMVSQGACALAFGPHWTEEDRRLTFELFLTLGRVWEVNESAMDAVTALSGSGPAYIYQLVAAMAQAGIQLGLQPEQAQEMTAQTALGAATMLTETGQDAETLTQQVVSKGGTTEAALKVFEQHHFAKLVAQAMQAAAKRSAELSHGGPGVPKHQP